MADVQKISPCLWFDGNGEEAARFYVSIFKNSRMGAITRFGKEGFEIHGRPAGSVMTVNFVLDGQEFTGLNGGPLFKFNEAISLVVNCDSQAEIDHYWEKLGAGGDPQAQQCGWLKDKYGLSWQVFPAAIMDMLSDSNRAKSQAAMAAMMKMKKMGLATLRKAYNEA